MNNSYQLLQAQAEKEKRTRMKNSNKADSYNLGKDIQQSSLVKAGTSFVDALGNIPITIGNTLISPFTDYRVSTQDTIPGEDFYKSLGRSAGNAFGLTGLSAGIGTGATKGLQATGQAIPSAQKATSYLTSGRAAPSVAGRFGEAATSSALLSPDETMQAAKDALLYQSIFESLPFVGKAAKGTLDYVPGSQYMEDMIARMQGQMNKSETEASELFKLAEEAGANKRFNISEAIPATPSEFNPETMTFSKEIPGTPAQTTRFTEQMALEPFDFNKQTKETYSAFAKDPSYENAFKLQSDLGSQARKITSKTQGDIIAREKIESAREALKKDIELSLLGENSEAAGYLSKAMHKFATDVAPTRENAKLMQIKEGLIGPSGPHTREGMLGMLNIKEMQQLLKKELSATKKNGGYKFPETHAFHKELTDLNKRADRSTMAAAVNPAAWLMMLGKHYGLNTFDLLQNPEILNALATTGEATRFTGPKAATAIAGEQ